MEFPCPPNTRYAKNFRTRQLGPLTAGHPRLSVCHVFGCVGKDNMRNCEPLEPRRLLAAVTDTLVTAGATWRYLDTGVDAGPTWIQPTYDDSAWRSGAAPLGYGDGDEATVV